MGFYAWNERAVRTNNFQRWPQNTHFVGIRARNHHDPLLVCGFQLKLYTIRFFTPTRRRQRRTVDHGDISEYTLLYADTSVCTLVYYALINACRCALMHAEAVVCTCTLTHADASEFAHVHLHMQTQAHAHMYTCTCRLKQDWCAHTCALTDEDRSSN